MHKHKNEIHWPHTPCSIHTGRLVVFIEHFYVRDDPYWSSTIHGTRFDFNRSGAVSNGSVRFSPFRLLARPGPGLSVIPVVRAKLYQVNAVVDCNKSVRIVTYCTTLRDGFVEEMTDEITWVRSTITCDGSVEKNDKTQIQWEITSKRNVCKKYGQKIYRSMQTAVVAVPSITNGEIQRRVWFLRITFFQITGERERACFWKEHWRQSKNVNATRSQIGCIRNTENIEL